MRGNPQHQIDLHSQHQIDLHCLMRGNVRSDLIFGGKIENQVADDEANDSVCGILQWLFIIVDKARARGAYGKRVSVW